MGSDRNTGSSRRSPRDVGSCTHESVRAAAPVATPTVDPAPLLLRSRDSHRRIGEFCLVELQGVLFGVALVHIPWYRLAHGKFDELA